jgi:hypothetical protein
MGDKIIIQEEQGLVSFSQVLQGLNLTPQGRGGGPGVPDQAEQVQGLLVALGGKQAPGQEIGIIPVLRVLLVGFLGPDQGPGIIILEGFLSLLEIIPRSQSFRIQDSG